MGWEQIFNLLVEKLFGMPRLRGELASSCSTRCSRCSAAPGNFAALGTPTPRGEARYGRMTAFLGVQWSSALPVHDLAGEGVPAALPTLPIPVDLPSEVHLPPHVGRTLNVGGGVPILAAALGPSSRMS